MSPVLVRAGGFVLLAALALSALAAPLGSPVALRAHGDVRASAAVSGEGTLNEIGHLPVRTGRFDFTVVDGFGVWVDASWLTIERSGNTRDQGWDLAGGARYALWFHRFLAVGASARTGFGHSWAVVAPDVRQQQEDSLVVTASPALILGPKDSGVYAWVGPAFALHGSHNPLPGGGDWDFSDEYGRFGGEIGAELHSENVLGPGTRRELYLSTGLDAHFGDRFGLGAWLGTAF